MNTLYINQALVETKEGFLNSNKKLLRISKSRYEPNRCRTILSRNPYFHLKNNHNKFNQKTKMLECGTSKKKMPTKPTNNFGSYFFLFVLCDQETSEIKKAIKQSKIK